MRARRLKRMIALTVILMVPALPASGGVVARGSGPAGTTSVWQIEFVDGYSFGYQSSSLALDALDSPFIAYLRDGVRVALAHKIGQTWHRGFVDKGDSGAAVALSSGGLPRISYDRGTNLRVSIGTKAGWLTGRLDDANSGSSTSIAVAPGGGIGVAYEGSGYLLRFALITRQKTTIETVDSPSAGWSSLVFDETGLPHIAYLDQSNVTVKYAYRTSQGSWITTSIEGCSFAGAGHSLALEPTWCVLPAAS